MASSRRTSPTARAPQPASPPPASRPRRHVRRWLAVGALVLAVPTLVAVVTSRRARTTQPQPTPGLQSTDRESRRDGVSAEEAALRDAVRRAPGDAKARSELAAYLTGHGRPIEALWELSLAGDPAPDRALQVAGALRVAGLPDAAVPILEQGLKANSSDALVLSLVDAYLTLARPTDALAVLRAHPTVAASPEGLLALGRARFAAGDAAGARSAMLQCRDRGDRTVTADRLLGRMALLDGNWNEARARLGVAATADPDDAELHYEAAVALSGEPLPDSFSTSAARIESEEQRAESASSEPHDRAEALRHLAAALRRNPRHAQAICAVARLQHESRGDWRGATGAYGQALKIDRDLPEASLGLARALAHLQMPAEMAYHQGRYLRLRSRPDAAIAHFRRWGELRPERWESPLRVAECQTDMARDRDAAATLEAAVRRFPEQTSLSLLLGQLYLSTLALNDAARLAGEWRDRSPEDAWPHWLRGRVALSAGRADEARSAFETALAKRPGEPILQLALADALAREPTPERLRRARELLEAAEAADPYKPPYPAQLATVLLNLNEPEAALAAHLRALRLDPRGRSAYGSVAQIAQRLGHPSAAGFFADLGRRLRREGAALRLATSRLWEAPSDPVRRLQVARLLLARGDLARAADHLAVAAQSGHAEARSLLLRVRRLIAVSPSR